MHVEYDEKHAEEMTSKEGLNEKVMWIPQTVGYSILLDVCNDSV